MNGKPPGSNGHDGSPAVPPVAGRAGTSRLADRLAVGRGESPTPTPAPETGNGQSQPPASPSYSQRNVSPPPPPPRIEASATPPMSGLPNGSAGNGRRIAPKSARAALEPENVPMPTRRSRRVRHPLVIAGNAVFTLLILLAIVVGGALWVGKQRFEAPGPLPEEKTVNIPRGLGTRDIADLLAREGVIDQPWVFIGGVVALQARDGLKFGEYQFPKQLSLIHI